MVCAILLIRARSDWFRRWPIATVSWIHAGMANAERSHMDNTIGDGVEGIINMAWSLFRLNLHQD